MTKDAGGHGSNGRGGPAAAPAAHAAGVAAVGKPQMNAKAVDALSKADGSFAPNGSSPSKGYMVSIEGHEQAVPTAQMQGDRAREIINQYATAHADALSQKNAHLGRWTDGDKVYLDVSQNIRNKNQAINTGRARNQLGIYDLQGGRTIRTGGKR